MRVTSLGFCLRVIVNEKPLNLEKTTFNVLPVLLLIYVLNIVVTSVGCRPGEFPPFLEVWGILNLMGNGGFT